MSQPKNPKIQNLLDAISPQDLEKIQSKKFNSGNSIPVDQEWMVLAEWLRIAGYQAYLDAKQDRRDQYGQLIITMSEILTLIEANRKLEALDHYKNAHSSFIGAVAAQTKKPSKTFKSLTRSILDRTRIN